ncbi:receptor expression-enhancing protein 2-like isoform X3 [Lineus longissimus]|uniref:receptor expression-enhancing protein 2-like isoform X3 n=1 Tax=Lineus longissimus TaxID=88925 RepID=UPI00315CA118
MPVAHSGMVLETYIDWYRSVMVLLIYTFCRLVFGTLYPAYSSYKAVKTKNVKEYVRWMMYWIVFALFTFIETLTDAFLSWIPFYYEIKIVFVIWLLSPATRGSSILYRKFVHPQLMKRERDIDDCIATAKDKGCAALMTFGTRGLNYAANTVVQTALKGQFIFLQYIMSKPWQGQSVVADHLKKSYSMNDLSERSSNEEVFDETDLYVERQPRHLHTSSHENLSTVGRRKRHTISENYSSELYELHERDEEQQYTPTPETSDKVQRRTHAQKENYQGVTTHRTRSGARKKPDLEK